ncbi:hypothetical protein L1O03_02905 [Corynebacterium uropygiale]|uniref:Uncharacterized protein n=1 Tax=Corynebacterium uropygiale TaxID=1775911 RepID=A0A9X1U6W5_9CORY|nr:hypothetical protein [Corynebacterium uropygiale]MCF4006127.1 hypothetical protein [Corynebacterium uropygiale]
MRRTWVLWVIIVALIIAIGVVATALYMKVFSPVKYEGTDVGMPNPTVSGWEQPPIDDPHDLYGQVDQNNAEDVIRAVMTQFFSFDFRPGHDETIQDAPERTKPLLLPEFYDNNHLGFSAQVGLPGTVWTRWKADHEKPAVAVKVLKDDHPQDSPEHVSRVVAIEVTDSKKHTYQWTGYVTVTSRGWWRVSYIHFSDQGVLYTGGGDTPLTRDLKNSHIH